jgi:hypothetical protein
VKIGRKEGFSAVLFLSALRPIHLRSLLGAIGSDAVRFFAAYARAGGNIRWLENNRIKFCFMKPYCRLRDEKIPFEQIWKPRARC